MKHFYILSILAFSLLSMNAKAGDGNKTWKVKYENPKEFIENKGQFLINETTENNAKVLYAVDNGATKIE